MSTLKQEKAAYRRSNEPSEISSDQDFRFSTQCILNMLMEDEPDSVSAVEDDKKMVHLGRSKKRPHSLYQHLKYQSKDSQHDEGAAGTDDGTVKNSKGQDISQRGVKQKKNKQENDRRGGAAQKDTANYASGKKQKNRLKTKCSVCCEISWNLL